MAFLEWGFPYMQETEAKWFLGDREKRVPCTQVVLIALSEYFDLKG